MNSAGFVLVKHLSEHNIAAGRPVNVCQLFNDMNNDQINNAIAKSLGCTDCHVVMADYCNDLNAMHEAEKSLDKWGLRLLYLVHLDKCGGLNCEWTKICADARQRAEAYLRTIGKWTEGGAQ